VGHEKLPFAAIASMMTLNLVGPDIQPRRHRSDGRGQLTPERAHGSICCWLYGNETWAIEGIVPTRDKVSPGSVGPAGVQPGLDLCPSEERPDQRRLLVDDDAGAALQLQRARQGDAK